MTHQIRPFGCVPFNTRQMRIRTLVADLPEDRLGYFAEMVELGVNPNAAAKPTTTDSDKKAR